LRTLENVLLRRIFGHNAGSNKRMEKVSSLQGFTDRIKADERRWPDVWRAQAD
jgi:hypothetical protein